MTLGRTERHGNFARASFIFLLPFDRSSSILSYPLMDTNLPRPKLFFTSFLFLFFSFYKYTFCAHRADRARKRKRQQQFRKVSRTGNLTVTIALYYKVGDLQRWLDNGDNICP